MVVITFDNSRPSRSRRLLRGLAVLVGLGPRRSRKRRPPLHPMSDHLKRDIGLCP